jgi:hypothetical protein
MLGTIDAPPPIYPRRLDEGVDWPKPIAWSRQGMICGDVPSFGRGHRRGLQRALPHWLQAEKCSLSKMRPVEGVSVLRLAARPMARGQKFRQSHHEKPGPRERPGQADYSAAAE